MEVTITQFRRELFKLVESAMAGTEVVVTHKGRRFRLAPDGEAGSRLERIIPLEIVNPESSANDETMLHQEMQRAWENDWASL